MWFQALYASEDNKEKCLKRIAVIHGVASLAQRAKQIASNENHAKHQHAFIQPAGHTAGQTGRLQLKAHHDITCAIQFCCAVVGATGDFGCGRRVFLSTAWFETAMFGNRLGVCRVKGTAVSFCGATGFMAAAAPTGFGVARIASFCFSSGLSAW